METPTHNTLYKNIPTWLWISSLALAVVPYLLSLGVTIQGPDGTVYAMVAKEMVWRNDYIQLFLQGQDWLDKPHLQFWITAFSYQLFGINEWGYRFPALLFILVGAVYTYVLGKRLYGREVALPSALIFLTALHSLIGFIDLRNEAYLTTLIIASVFHFYQAKELPAKWLLHLILGAFFAGAAAMSKGMIGLIPIGAAILGEILIKREWSELLKVKWYLAILLTLVFMSPELVALYLQFDAQPPKEVYGGWTADSGIRFFFWDSQWGRFSNTGPITGNGDPSFFFHTLLWAFLPWSILLYAALIKRTRENIPKVDKSQEFYLISAIVVPFFLFTLSSFKLSHYLSILFPFCAILTAVYLQQLGSRRWMNFYRITQWALIALGVLAISGFFMLYRPKLVPISFWVFVLLALGLFMFVSRSKEIGQKAKVFFQTVFGFFLVHLFLAQIFYPNLLVYQGDDKAAIYLNQQKGDAPIALYQMRSSILEFYIDRPLKRDTSFSQNPDLIFFTDDSGKKKLEGKGLDMEEVKRFQHFSVTKLNIKFLNHKTRSQAIQNRYLIRLRKEEKQKLRDRHNSGEKIQEMSDDK